MDIFEVFSSYTVLPIRLDDVIAQALEYGVVDRFEFYAAKLDTEILLGMHRTVEMRGEKVCQIFFAEDLSSDPRLLRVVCAKEILHALDDEAHSARSRQAVSNLVDQVVIPPSSGLSASTRSDHNGIAYALMVLAPRDALHILRPKIAEGKLTASDIAELADIPESFARLVISDLWEDLCEKIG